MTITNLKNTTWTIPRGWSATAGYGEFDITGSSALIAYGSTETVDYNFVILSIGFLKASNTSDRITLYNSEGSYIGIANGAEFSTLTFTGGTDATNPDLIAWLQKYGELQSNTEEEEETPTIPVIPAVEIAYKDKVINLASGQTARIHNADGSNFGFTEDLVIKVNKFDTQTAIISNGSKLIIETAPVSMGGENTIIIGG